MKLNQISLLAHGQFVSVIGDTVFDVALSYWVLELTGSVTIMASVNSLSLIMRILFSSFAGTVVDMSNKKHIIILCDLIRGCAMLLLSILMKLGKTYIWMYFAIMIIIDSSASFFKPAINSSLVLLSDKQNMERANAKLNNANFIAEICGNGIVTLFFDLVSIPFLFFVNGVSYIYSLITELFLKIPHTENIKRKGNFFINIKEGYEFIVKRKDFIAFIFFCCIINLLTSMTNILFLPFFKSFQELGIKTYSLAMLLFSIGSISASTLIDKKLITFTNPIRTLVTSTFIFTSAMIVFSIFTIKIIVCITFFIGGFFTLIRQIILVTALQKSTTPKFLGSTFSFYSMALNLVKPISYMIGGIISDIYGTQYILIAIFVLSAVFTLIFSRNKYFMTFLENNYILH